MNKLEMDKKVLWECQDANTSWSGVVSGVGELTDTTVKLPYRSDNYIWKANFRYGWVAIE